jgi:uncharacterized membrane protein YfcA
VTILGLLLAALIGLSLGIMGAGGSILTVPIFVYVLDFGAKEAIASSLAVVGVTSLFGALEHQRKGHVRLALRSFSGCSPWSAPTSAPSLQPSSAGPCSSSSSR